MPGVLQQYHVTRTRQNRIRIRLNRTPGNGNDLAPRHHCLEGLDVDNLSREMHIRGKPLAQALDPIRFRRPRSENLSPEPDRVLDRVKAFENHKAPRPSGPADVCEIHLPEMIAHAFRFRWLGLRPLRWEPYPLGSVAWRVRARLSKALFQP